MFNWIKNLFGLKQEAPKAVLDTTTNWPFPTAEKPVMSAQPAVNDPAPVMESPTEVVKEVPVKKPRKSTTKSKAAPAPTKAKKPAAIKTAVKATAPAAKSTKRKPKAK